VKGERENGAKNAKNARPTFSNQLVFIISIMDLIFSCNFGIGQVGD
jgi:hypothetical protein